VSGCEVKQFLLIPNLPRVLQLLWPIIPAPVKIDWRALAQENHKAVGIPNLKDYTWLHACLHITLHSQEALKQQPTLSGNHVNLMERILNAID
jgi:hypothetical protein